MSRRKKKRRKRRRRRRGRDLAQVKSEWHSANGLLGNFMGVVKWLSWTCQLQTACQNATQAFPPPGGGCVAAMKTKHVYMRLMADEGVSGLGWVWSADGGQIIHTQTRTKHYSNAKWVHKNTQVQWSVNDILLSPYVSVCKVIWCIQSS